MDYLVTMNQMDDSFKAVMQSLKNQIEIHYDEVRRVAKEAEAILDRLDAIAQEVAEETVKQTYNSINAMCSTANVMAIDAQLTK